MAINSSLKVFIADFLRYKRSSNINCYCPLVFGYHNWVSRFHESDYYRNNSTLSRGNKINFGRKPCQEIRILWRELFFNQMFFFQKRHIILHYVPTGKILTGFKFVSPENPADAARTPKQRIYFLLVFCIRMKSLL